jgi:phage-related minor tail protein
VNGSLESGFIAMVKGTQTVGEAFRSMAAAIIEELFRVLVVQKLVGGITSAFTGGAGGFTNAQAGRLTGGGRASGGSMMAGGSYLVGENGPEIVVPRHSGTVVNANQTSGAMAGSGGITVQNNITVTGSDAAMVRQEVAKMIPQITNATKAAVIDAKQRGGQMAAAFR